MRFIPGHALFGTLTCWALLAGSGCGGEIPNSDEDETATASTKQALSSLPVRELPWLLVPSHVLLNKQTLLIRSDAEAVNKLQVPSGSTGVDFSKEFLVFYAAGGQPTDGWTAKLTLDDATVTWKTGVSGTRGWYQLNVDVNTVLDSPGTGCPEERPGMSTPWKAIAVNASSLRNWSAVKVESLHAQHQTNIRSCETAPGPRCDGPLTPAGLDDIKKRSGGGVPVFSTRSMYAQHRLARYSIEKWSRECIGSTCKWLLIPRTTSPANYPLAGVLYYYETPSESRLTAFSDESRSSFNAGGGLTYYCTNWAESWKSTVSGGSSAGRVSAFSLRGSERCTPGGWTIKDDEPLKLDNFSGTLGDRCARLTQTSGSAGAPLMVLTASW